MSLPCPQGVVYVTQEVQDCHLLVQVTGKVSDTPLSQPLTAVMQSPRPMTRQYILLRLTMYVNGGVYIYVAINLLQCTQLSFSCHSRGTF